MIDSKCDQSEAILKFARVEVPRKYYTHSSIIFPEIIKLGFKIEPRDAILKRFKIRDVLERAIRKNDLELIIRLIRLGVNVSLKNMAGTSALFSAVSNNRVAITDALLNSGCSVNECDFGLKTPLHVAACDNNLAIMKFLLEKGADVDAIDIDFNSALHEAVLCRNLGAVLLLLNNRADSNSLNAIGHRPLDYAFDRTCQGGVIESACASLLRAYGAKLGGSEVRVARPKKLSKNLEK